MCRPSSPSEHPHTATSANRLIHSPFKPIMKHLIACGLVALSISTAWAQAGRPIPIFGTTQADYFHGEIPCSRLLTPGEVEEDYEGLTGHLIVETLKQTPILTMPGVLVANHGPFSWGKSADDAVHNAVVLEEVARMAWLTGQINPGARPLPDYLLEKHYQRKHGKHAYYGQTKA